jgi:hypothetical protein
MMLLSRDLVPDGTSDKEDKDNWKAYVSCDQRKPKWGDNIWASTPLMLKEHRLFPKPI